MRRILLSITVAAAALAAAAPAAAQQGYGYGNRGYGYNQGRSLEQQIDQLEYRIRMAADRRMISRQEAFRLSRQVRQIEWQYDRYRRNGINQWEYRDIQNRIQNLRQQLRWDRNDRGWDDRGRDRDDRYDRDRRYRDRDDDDDDDDDD